jgi:hypothetical protein
MKNIIICGCVRNCEKYIDNVFENIGIISKYCNLIKIIISFDISNDKSLLKLCQYKNKFNVDIILNKNELNSNRVINITNARNKYMEHMNNLKEKIDNFIVMDFDDVCSKLIEEKQIRSVLEEIENGKYNNTAITFSNERYYDFWALSIDEYIFSIWHTNEAKNIMRKMKRVLFNSLLNCENYIVVDSAFNGFAIYDYNAFKNIRYDYEIKLDYFDKCKIQNFVNKHQITTKNPDCEHRLFHLKANKINNTQVIILKDNIFPPYLGEHASFLYD